MVKETTANLNLNGRLDNEDPPGIKLLIFDHAQQFSAAHRTFSKGNRKTAAPFVAFGAGPLEFNAGTTDIVFIKSLMTLRTL
jgi:hypothetical protein